MKTERSEKRVYNEFEVQQLIAAETARCVKACESVFSKDLDWDNRDWNQAVERCINEIQKGKSCDQYM